MKVHTLKAGLLVQLLLFLSLLPVCLSLSSLPVEPSIFREPPLPPCDILLAFPALREETLQPQLPADFSQNWLNPSDTCWKQDTAAGSFFCEATIQLLMTNSSAALNSACSAQDSEQIYSKKNIKTLSFAKVVTDAVPSVHISSRCQGCGYGNNSIMFSKRFGLLNGLANGSVIGQSRWSGFINAVGLKASTAAIVAETEEISCDVVISRPVFVLDMICLQVGHLIIDILEPLYYVMVNTYGRVDRNALIFIDIADQKWATSTMPAALSRDVFHRDSMFQLLRLFTKHTIHSKRVLDRIDHSSSSVCFQDIHLQLDVAHSFSIEQHPPATHPLRQNRYQDLQNFLLSGLGVTVQAREGKPLTVAMVERRGKRRLSNFESLSRIVAEGFGVEVMHVRFEELSFSEQVRVMKEMDVFISQQGTGFHNVLFMRPGTTAVLIMQPGWCAFHWQFSDQALLLNISVVVLCQDGDAHALRFGKPVLQDYGSSRVQMSVRSTYRWHKKAYLQGPWHSKSVDVVVDEGAFASAIAAAKEMVSLDKPSATKIRVISGIDQPPSPVSSAKPKHIRPFLSLDNLQKTSTMISTIPEVVIEGKEPLSLESLEDMRLCVGYAAEGTAKYCQNFSLFEFDTLDVAIDKPVLLKLWVESNEVAFSAESTSNVGPPTFVILPQNPQLLQNLSKALLGREILVPIEHLYPAYISVRFHSEAVWETAQLVLSAGCLAHKLSDENCARVVDRAWGNMLTDYLTVTAGLPAPQPVPTVRKPFVFMHLEKTGGACFGTMLSRTSETWKGIVPCHGGVNCYTFDYTNQSLEINDAVVMGGHFNWGFWETQAVPLRKEAACFTLARHPVSRVISFYYERVYAYSKRTMSELSVEELVGFLERFRGSGFGKWRDEGMSNAGCKMLSGARIFTGKAPTDNILQVPWSFEIASPRLSTCVVGLQEEWEKSMDHVNFWFPWMKTAIKEGCTPLEKNMRSWVVETKETLRPDLRETILAFNECDLKLYLQATAQFQRQQHFVAIRGGKSST